MSPWLQLFIAGLCEVAFAVGLKYAEGFTRPVPSLAVAFFAAISLWFLSAALRTIPVGTGYAVWTGIGAVGTVAVGMFLFDEPRSALRLACIGLILAGIVGLRLVGSDGH